MKFTLLLFVFSLAFLRAETDVRASKESGVTSQVEEFESPRGGKVRIEKTYRGEALIMKVTTTSEYTTRMLVFQGEPRYIEADEDGDGHFESVMLPGGSGYDFEPFRRLRNGSLVPYSEEEYRALKSTAAKATDTLREALERVEKELETRDSSEPQTRNSDSEARD